VLHPTDHPVPQSGAVPFRLTPSGSPEVLLVSNRRGDRWVFPKGRIDAGNTAESQAQLEAWEEGGILGTLLCPPVGSFDYLKGGRVHRVRVYLLEVNEELETWPEKRSRGRRWMPLSEAMRLHGRPEARYVFSEALREIASLAKRSSPVG